MKILFCIIPFLLFINILNSQNLQNGIKTLSQEQYREYFPIKKELSQFSPTTDYVCILPTNETDKVMQAEINEYYMNSFIKQLPTVANQTSKVITDKQALLEDLSNINIYAFGTIKGNLWITKFIERAKDFPIIITSDSVITDKVYLGDKYVVTASWYNLDNFKHSVFLYIPQQLDYAKIGEKVNFPQYSIWQDRKQIRSSHQYILKNNQWQFSYARDTTLDFRDLNHSYFNPFEEIERYQFYRYPTLKQLGTSKIDENDVLIDTIRISNINNEFNNLPDMEWLKPIAKKYKIIALGESHHLKYNNYIFKRILFAINTFDYYPSLILELPYSFTGYFNHFLSIKDDKIAISYRDSVLTKIFEPGILTIEAIRNWNKQHINKIIQVGFSDLEHNLPVTINVILNPYFRKLGAVTIPDINKYNDNIEFYLEQGQKLMDQAKKQNIIGEFPFQTPEYMESVLENLITTLKIKMDSKNNNDFTARYQAMTHNVTDKHFLGQSVISGKSLFFGGFEHFRTLNDGTNKKATLTEGYYLAHTFEPTKGKVYSIYMNNKGTSIEDSIQLIDPRLAFRIETDLIKLFKERKIKIGEPVLGFSFSELDKFIYALSFKYPNYAIRLRTINLDNILNKYQGFVRFMEYIYIKDLQDFNTSIIIPYSPIGN